MEICAGKLAFRLRCGIPKCYFSSMKDMVLLRLLAASLGAACLLPGCISLWAKEPKPPEITRVETGRYQELPSVETKPAPPVVKDPAPTVSGEKPVSKIPTAVPVPGKDGVVFSPFNNKPIDVKGFASGTLVADPTFPITEKKYFRVP
jgi:hypothetical protein